MHEEPVHENGHREGFAPAALAIALLSGAILLFELVLVRLFSFLTWHHYAFVVISIALLGFAASGVALQVWPALGQPPRRRAALYSGLFGVSAVVAVGVMGRVQLGFEADEVSKVQEVVSLLVNYVVLIVPFLFAGLAIATLLNGYTRRVGLLYGCDLLGAGVGCAAMVASIPIAGAEGLVAAAAAGAAGAAAILAVGERRTVVLWSVTAVLFVAAAPSASTWLAVPPGPGKALQRHLANQGGENNGILETHWNALFRTDVVVGPARIVWTTNAFVQRPQPPQHHIIIDGDAATPLYHLPTGPLENAGAALDFLDDMVPTLAHQALKPEHVLVIGSGGGVDVLAALHHGARKVDAVEINPDIVRLHNEAYTDLSGALFEREGVTLHLDEGRSFIRRSTDRYDLIQLSLVDTWAASSAGAYSLVEGYLYTVEAFRDYLEHLSPNGAFTISRWLKVPPRESLRLVTVAREALREIGVEDPARHMVVAVNGNVANIVVKRLPFTDDEIAAVHRVADERFFAVVHPLDPGPRPTGNASRRSFENFRSQLLNALTGEILGPEAPANIFSAYLGLEDPATFYAAYAYDVTPVRDERPFFFEFGRWSTLLKERSGKQILLAVILQAIVLSCLLLVLPMMRGRTLWREARGAVAYFLLIGIAFMLLEVALIQRLTLYLGHPVFGLSLVLLALLVGAGLGSMASGRLLGRLLVGTGDRRPALLFGGIMVVSALYAVALPSLFQATLALPLSGRLMIAGGLVLPLGFLLGMPFPTAMAELGRTSSPLVGWAWAANGCGSVLGPLVAMLLGMDLGYRDVMLVAAVLYGVAWLILSRRISWGPRPS